MNTPQTPPAASAGFTLLELLVVLMILSVLLNVALPGYDKFFIKAQRQDAIALLTENSLRLERCFTLEGVYNGSCGLKSTSDDGHYTLSTNLTANSFSLTATPVSTSRQANDVECAAFTLSMTGARGATGTLGGNCW